MENIEILKGGGIGVIPTDTLYGLVGSALNPETVARVAKAKRRSDGKGFIVLISSLADLKFFGIELGEAAKIFLGKFWPGKVSVEFFYDTPGFEHLRRPEGCNAFRLPDKPDLIEILKKTGPLVAPSANPEGLPPALTIIDAKKYFGDEVDFYEDGGTLNCPPSTLIRIKNDQVEVIRPGAVKIKGW